MIYPSGNIKKGEWKNDKRLEETETLNKTDLTSRNTIDNSGR